MLGGESMNPVDNMELIRKRKGITKTHIAKHCSRSVSWYADIAKGRRRVYLDDFLMIADAMSEDVKVFFDNKLSATLNKPKKSKPA